MRSEHGGNICRKVASQLKDHYEVPVSAQNAFHGGFVKK